MQTVDQLGPDVPHSEHRDGGDGTQRLVQQRHLAAAALPAVIGAGLGMMSKGTAGRNLNLFVIVVGVFRLILGGGIF